MQTQKPYTFLITPGRRQSKTLIISTNEDKKSIETEFVARLAIVNTVSCDYYSRSSIVKRVFDCRLLGMFIILHQLCALLDVVSCSNYEKTTPVKRTVTATAGIH